MRKYISRGFYLAGMHFNRIHLETHFSLSLSASDQHFRIFAFQSRCVSRLRRTKIMHSVNSQERLGSSSSSSSIIAIYLSYDMFMYYLFYTGSCTWRLSECCSSTLQRARDFTPSISLLSSCVLCHCAWVCAFGDSSPDSAVAIISKLLLRHKDERRGKVQ